MTTFLWIVAALVIPAVWGCVCHWLLDTFWPQDSQDGPSDPSPPQPSAGLPDFQI